MTGIFGRGTSAKEATAAGSLQLQSAQRGGVKPLVYGTTRVAPNLLDYDDFHSMMVLASNVGKGKGGAVSGKSGKGQAMVTEYVASFILGVCQGPIAGFGQVWYDKYVTTLGAGILIPSSVNLGADGQAPDPYWLAAHAYKALGYSGTANIVFANYNLGVTSALSNFSLEVVGLLSASGVNGRDASPDQIIVDYLTNPRYGAGFPPANLDLPSFDNSIPSSYATYVQALGLWLSISLETQEEAQQRLDTLTKLTNSEIVWSGGLLKIIPRGDVPVTGAISSNSSWTITLQGGDASGVRTTTATITDPVLGTSTAYSNTTAGEHLGDIANSFVAALNTIVAQFGIIITSVTSAESPPAGPPPLSQNNSAIVVISLIQDPPLGTTNISVTGPNVDFTVVLSTTSSGGIGTFVPNTLPIYSLTDDDFIPAGSASSAGGAAGVTPGGTALRSGAGPITGTFSDDPVHIARSSPADADNVIKLECLDRSVFYNSTVVEVSDQAAIDAYGLRSQSSLNARGIVDPGYVGYTVAQLLLQRSLLYRNTYTFRLGWKYILLEPMDLIQITDPLLGAASLTIRITSVAEDEEGTLTVTAEDWFGAYSPAVLYPTVNFAPAAEPSVLGFGASAVALKIPQLNGATSINQNQQPGATNPPIIFFPPQELVTSATGYEVWIALSGQGNWGGAQVWLSSDGESYTSIGQITGITTMGTTTAVLDAFGGTNPDISSVLAVDVTESGGALTSVSDIHAANGATLSYVNGEILSFTTAELLSPFRYNLTELYRGLFGSPIVSQPAGVPFARLGPTVGRFPIAANLIGQTVYLKFLAFNETFGGGESLADVTSVSLALTPTNQNRQQTTISGSETGTMSAGAALQLFTVAQTTTLPTNLGGSVGSAGTAASGLATFHIQRNGSNVGAMIFAAGSATAVFALSTPTAFNPGDVLGVIAPSPADGSLASVSWTLIGYQ